ncbi:MAG: hypothetical protein JWN41_292, partial [Thermoleophilia bacterium]|nr:hypothetical protein [Thermoleophilia bacterium]
MPRTCPHASLTNDGRSPLQPNPPGGPCSPPDILSPVTPDTPPPRPRLRDRLARVTIDISALRTSAAFRRMFGAQLVSSIGTQVTLVALFYQVYHLNKSTLE